MKTIITIITILCVLFTTSFVYSQSENFRFKQLLQKDSQTPSAFAIAYDSDVLKTLLKTESVIVKSVTPNWIYIQASPIVMNELEKSKKVKHFYFEFAPPSVLNDTTRATHFVDQIHQGIGGLQSPFTGKNVIMGFVDQGLDYTHPDFIDSAGQTRVLYYWDHTAGFSPTRTPAEYGYGQLWSANDIQTGICTANEVGTAHGTSVTGAGAANGLANGKEKGMAPDSKLIVIETNFNLPNWTLTIADACDFIFKVADSMGLPAVVNLSLGTYLGSHDGNDPAAELMEALVDAKPGRIIVCAAGNSGNWGKYHVHNDVDTDTSFVWYDPNPSSQLGANTVYFDLWSDSNATNWDFALSANLPSGSYAERATSIFRPAQFSVNTPYFDTLFNSNGDRIATVELYPEFVGANFHMEVYFSNVDSTTYKYGFKTTGTGSYDAWSGLVLSLNNIVSVIPTVIEYPNIIHYRLPDTLQTIVSSWNCSEKIISVGNVRNRFGHTDKNGNYYQPAPTYNAVVGQLSPNSSKGPSRKNVIKPDVSACGDVTLSAGSFSVLNNTGNNSAIDIDGLHLRNGGTSMASPVVAGIAALYLEKCNLGTYNSFKTDLQATAFSDGFTGTVPNFAYGYGKIHGLNLLLESNYTTSVSGTSVYCPTDSLLAVSGAVAISTINWSNGDSAIQISPNAAGNYFFSAYSNLGCISYSDTLALTPGDVPPTPAINAVGTTLSTASYPNLQWYENGVLIPGATNNTYVITLPNSNNYTVVATGSTGCAITSGPYNASLGIEENGESISVFPNPSQSEINIVSTSEIRSLKVIDYLGKQMAIKAIGVDKINISELSTGTYFLIIETNSGISQLKINKI